MARLGGPARRRAVEAEHLAPPALPAQVERGVADHAQEPGLERGSALEAGQVEQRLDEAFLNGVEGVGLVPEQTVGHPKRMGAVSPEQVVQRLTLPGGKPAEQLVVAGLK